MSHVTIIDYGSGNLHSIAKAFEREAEPLSLRVTVSSRAEDIRTASHVVLPGVGAFGDCLKGLKALGGVWEALNEAVHQDKKPFMGVCVGMQMLADLGEENGKHTGFGWINGTVKRITPSDPGLKIPHMGWNEIQVTNQSHPVMHGIHSGDHVYFVHSYHFDCQDKQNILALTEYGAPLVAAIAKDNMVASQFHPEKSQQVGLRFIANFLAM